MDAIDASADADAAATGSSDPLRRARAGADHHRVTEQIRARRSRRSRSHKGVITPRGRDQPPGERSRRAPSAGGRRLFDDEKDPIVVIKWKEMLDFLEDATDRCEDVANVLEGVVVKHG